MKDTAEFIKDARKIHGNEYSYHFSKYANSKIKLTIGCQKHGAFEQTPDAHIHQKQGCPKCGINKLSSTTQQFIQKAKQVHGDTYDYSKVNYINNQTKVTITCKEHGDFEQRPSKHTCNKRGCPKCGRERTKNYQKENFIGWSYSD